MPKTLIINEKQYNKLFTEAMQPGFRLDALRGRSFNFKKQYLEQFFGKPIGSGSSRWVYQIDDDAVLKVAVNDKGIAQNESEHNLLANNWLSIVPKLLNGSDEENYEWIVTEFVLPAKAGDFKKLLGLTFKEVSDFCRDNELARGNSLQASLAHKRLIEMFDKYEDNDEVTEFFSDIQSYQADYERSSGDLMRIINWGLANREYGPQLVVLDAGLTPEIFNNFYRRR